MAKRSPVQIEVELTPSQAERQIEFALAQLDTQNAHHEFEHLCRHLVKARICSNVIPSTGPVSGGGDGGIDFETYEVSGALGASRFLGRAASERWIFACSLEKNTKKKVKGDLELVSKLRPKPHKLVFLTNQPVKISTKNALRVTAIDDYDLELEPFGLKELASMLAEPDTVWIAERFLDLPSAFALARPDREERWYQDLLELPEDAPLLEGTFYKLKDAVRETSRNPDQRSDCLRLFVKLRAFRESDSRRISRRAIYEEFFAALRGLEDPHGFADDLRTYMVDPTTLTSTADLQDAATIVSYALAARFVENFSFPLEELTQWHNSLTSRIDQLIALENSAGRLTSLLLARASLTLSSVNIKTEPNSTDRTKVVEICAIEAISLWRRILTYSDEAPLFSFELLADISDAIAPIIDNLHVNKSFQRELEKVISSRAGTKKSVERYIRRANSFLDAGNKLRALRELHSAHSKVVDDQDAVLLSAELGALYERLNLHFAAKMYGLSSAWAAIKLPNEQLRSLAYAGIATAAATDYASGGSLMFLLSAEIFLFLATYFSMSGSEGRQNLSWSQIEFHLIQIVHWSKLFDQQLHSKLLEKLQSWEMGDTYNQLFPSIERGYVGISSISDLDEATSNEGINGLFLDVGGMRTTSWSQLQIIWDITWPTTFQMERFAERFCASLQILLAELTDVELSIMAGNAHVELAESNTGQFRVEHLPDNDSISKRLHIPMSDHSFDEELHALSAAVMILCHFSGESDKEVMDKIHHKAAQARHSLSLPYASGATMFKEFYSEEKYKETYSWVANLTTRRPSAPKHQPELDGPTGPHPKYSAVDSRELAQKRYDRLLPNVRFTVRRLSSDATFQATLKLLRAKGWLDWHVLLAVANIRLNRLYGSRQGEHFEIATARMQKKFKESELETDPQLETSVFSEGELENALNLAQLSALETFEMFNKQQTPNFVGVDALLRRFGYWSDDVPHEDPFKTEVR